MNNIFTTRNRLTRSHSFKRTVEFLDLGIPLKMQVLLYGEAFLVVALLALPLIVKFA